MATDPPKHRSKWWSGDFAATKVSRGPFTRPTKPAEPQPAKFSTAEKYREPPKGLKNYRYCTKMESYLECDYCRGQGFYFIDGERCECFCLTQDEENESSNKNQQG